MKWLLVKVAHQGDATPKEMHIPRAEGEPRSGGYRGASRRVGMTHRERCVSLGEPQRGGYWCVCLLDKCRHGMPYLFSKPEKEKRYEKI